MTTTRQDEEPLVVMETLRIGLLGLGTVGGGAARLLLEQPDRIARRAGRPLRLAAVAVRDRAKPRTIDIGRVPLTNDAFGVVADREIDVIVETIGGTTVARELVLAALAAGKHVVTANKALLAEHGPEIFARAQAAGRAVAFEASVGGGVPIVQALGVALAANQIQSLAAILNGTCNFILTRMTGEGLRYADALSEAQRLGYAESDPTLDVDGTDTAHKLAILVQLAFETNIRPSLIARQGIDRLELADLTYAGELGYAVKLLALARLTASGLDLRVAPTLVKRGEPLAEVRGPYNAIRVVGDAVGDTLFQGRGAGAMPTASAVVADLIDVATGRAQATSRVARLWADSQPAHDFAPANTIKSRYYLRFTIADQPGVLGRIAQILGDSGISIASVIQHDSGDDAPESSPVPLVIMTHHAIQADLEAAIALIDRLDAVHASTVRIGVED